MIDITGLRADKRPQSSAIVHALLDRLEAVEKDAAHQKAIADSALRVAEGWEEKCNSLRAKIEAMERQEPAYWGPKHAIEGGSTTVIVGKFPVNPTDAPLYALPGAQPAPSVPDGWKLVPTVPTKEMRAAWDSSPICEDDDAEFRRAYSEMLAAAPEAKP